MIQTKNPSTFVNGFSFGADNQIRTGDLILTKDVLYLLSYISESETYLISAPTKWQGQKGSNPRHSVLETDALPAELYPCIASLLTLVYYTICRLACQ